MQQANPDISDILQAKQQRRLALAALSWEEKVAIIEQMQRLLPQGQWKSKTVGEQGMVYEVEARQTPAEEDRPLVDLPPRQLVQVQGPPVSQTIIEERHRRSGSLLRPKILAGSDIPGSI